MQNNANKFNVYEKQIMQDKAFLLAKRDVIQKTETIFTQLHEAISAETAYLQQLKNALAIDFQGPKISKGENYKGLPYVVLDQPRYLVGNDIFTFRSMFWWGNFYSFSLFLQGEILENLKHFFDAVYMAKDENLYIGVGEKLWEYDLDETNYKLAKDQGETEISKIIDQHPFLKLTYFFPLQINEDEIVENGKKLFNQIMKFLNQ